MNEDIKCEKEPKISCNNKKFREYSAHDSTLYCVLSTLGIELDKLPYYASALIIELHKKENGKNNKIFFNNLKENYYLQFYYQPDENKRGTKEIWNIFKPKQCQTENCTVSFFQNEIDSFLPYHYSEERWIKNICKSDFPYYLNEEEAINQNRNLDKVKLLEKIFTILVIISSVILCIILTLIIINFKFLDNLHKNKMSYQIIN